MGNQLGKRGKATALVADDDHEFRQAIVEIIALDGWDVQEATNGEEVLQFVDKYNPDVLVLDHRMPRLTGAEVIQRMRECGIHIPVVFVSAAQEIHDVAANVGMKCLLMKPFGIEELLDLMHRARSGHCS